MIEMLRTKIAEAMKAGRKTEMGILRVLLGELQSKDITDDAPARKVVRTLMQNNQEAIRISGEAMKPEQREQLELENKVLQAYLPNYLSKDEIKVALQPMLQAIKEARNEGQATGFAIRYLKDRPVDGTTVKEAVAELRQ